MNTWELLKMLTSLVLVFGLMGLLLWALRRMQQRLQVQATSGQRLRLIDSLNVAARQKIVVIEVDGQRLVLGIGPGQVAALGQWPAPQPGLESAHVKA